MRDRAIVRSIKAASPFETIFGHRSLWELRFRLPARLGFLAAAVLLGSSHSARSADLYWGTTVGDWSTPANWGGNAPVLGDNAYIYNDGAASVTASNSKISSLYLGDAGAGKSGTVNITNGDLYAETAAYIGYGGAGTVTHSAGKLTSLWNGGVFLGYNPGASGTYNLSGTGQLAVGASHYSTSNSVYVGYSGSGVFNQLGGTNTVKRGSLYLGFNSGASGTYNHSSGTNTLTTENVMASGSRGLYLGFNEGATGAYNLNGTGQLISEFGYSEYVGYSGTGSFIHSAGTNTLKGGSNSLYLGYNTSANGTYELSDTGQLVSPTQYVGYSGTGTFNHSGGTNTGDLYLGYNAGASGTYNLSATGQRSGALYIGDMGTGAFNHTGGTNTTGDLILGNRLGGRGEYSFTGNGQLTAEREYVGYAATGTFIHSAGTNTISSGSLYLGYLAGSSGTYSLGGTGQLVNAAPSSPHPANGCQYVGYSGTGTFTHTAGTNTISGSLILGYNAGSSGTYALSGDGQLTVTSSISDHNVGNEYVGGDGAGTFNHSGGANTISNSLCVGGAKGIYNLSGTGQLSATNEYIDGRGDTALLQQTGGANTASYISIGTKGRYNFTAGTLQLNGSLINQGVFDFAGGSGIWNIAHGITNISSGNLPINTQAASLNVDANSLLIVPTNYHPAAAFLHYSNAGILHYAGTTLTVPEGKTISSSGQSSIEDHVNCQGTIAAGTGGGISLTGGLTVSGNGNVSLGGGALRNKDDSSGISGGSLSGASQMVGSSGAGTFTHTGGTNTLSTNLYVGYDSPGTYNLNGTGQLSSSNQYVGYSSTGTFNQLAGANTSYALYIGNGYASGTYNMDGGSLNVTAEHIGVQGEGTFNQTGGTHTLPQTAGVGNWGLSLGDKTGSSGTYNLSGTGELSSFQEVIGTQGTGIFTQSGGTNTISDRLVLAWSSGHGTYNLQGGQLNADKEYLGYYGGSTGVFTQTGGTNTVANTLYYGNSEGTGTYELNGGTLRLHTITVQNNAAFFRFGGGTLQATGDVSIRYDSGTPGQVVLPMTLTGVGGNANVDTAGYTITLADQLSGPGGLNKLGDNTLTLSASNTYGGGTIVKAGTLRVNNTTGSATGTGRVMVEANATLSGSGSIAGPLTIAGALAPGNSPGILTVNNQVTFRPGATFSVEINGLEAGSGYDQLATTGPVSLDGSLAVSFGSFTPTGDDVLFVVNNMGSAATTGMFQYADDSKIGMFNGYDWYITYDANNAAVPTLNGGNDVAIYSVPEPSSIALAGIGAASLFLYILRRRQ
jgi:hypothetical protein